MRQLARDLKFDFIGKTRIAVIISAVLIIGSLVSLGTRGLNLGIDFTGGTLIEVGYQQPADVNAARGALGNAGFPEAVVQTFGTTTDVLVRIAPREERSSADISTDVLAALQGVGGSDIEIRRVEFVGPQVGDELTNDGGLALLYALIGILIYVAFRFEKRFALGAVAALIHDVVITLGFFSVFQFNFDLTVVAALLAVIGYSLNDTIVVFDRIRENFRKIRKGEIPNIVNAAINQTLSRTLMTSGTTMLVLVALFVFGGEIIRYFSMALLFGIFVGTYSSIYIASTVSMALGISKADLMPVQKEGAELDARP